MDRAQLIAAIRVAGYHEDKRAGTRLLVDHRVSMATYKEAFEEGRRAKTNGAACTCVECNPVAEACA